MLKNRNAIENPEPGKLYLYREPPMGPGGGMLNYYLYAKPQMKSEECMLLIPDESIVLHLKTKTQSENSFPGPKFKWYKVVFKDMVGWVYGGLERLYESKYRER